MQPEPDVMLDVIAKKLVEHIAPNVDSYLQGDLHMLAMIIRAAAKRFDVEADVLVREHRAIEAIFDQVRAVAELALIVPREPLVTASLRLTELRARNRAELEAIAKLDASLDTLAEPPEGLRAAIDALMRDRATVHAFNTGPYATAGLAELQPQTMR